MSTAEEIQSAVAGLSAKELNRFSEWFEQFQVDAWDKQLEEDVAAGKLDHLAEEAIRDFREGRCTEL